MNLISNAIKFSHSGGTIYIDAVQRSGANIHVSSQIGLGTTFTVTLPIAQKAAISS